MIKVIGKNTHVKDFICIYKVFQMKTRMQNLPPTLLLATD